MVIGLLLLNKLGLPGNLVCYAILIIWSLRSPEAAIKALSISGLLICASDFFVTRSSAVGGLKYVLLLIAGLTIIRYARDPLGNTFVRLLLLFGAVTAILSFYNNYFVAVSLLKVVSFTFGAFCLLNIVEVRRDIAPEMLEWAFVLALVVVLMSYGALAIGAGTGEFTTIWGGRYSGYRGVFSHPQTMGVMTCMFAVLVTTLLLFVDFSKRLLAGAILLLLLVLVYLSGARTGVLGYILAMGCTLFLVGLGRSTPEEANRLRYYQQRFFSLVFVGILITVMLELATGSISQRVEKFIAKGKSYEDFNAQVLLSARQEQMERSLKNFKESPLTGIGFGTDKNIQWQRTATLLSASTEKGFLPTALLEEVGIIGVTFFALFVLSLLAYFLRTRRYLGLAMVIGLLVVNLGEMMFFAFGGMAMLCWPLIAMCMAVSNAQLQQFTRRPG